MKFAGELYGTLSSLCGQRQVYVQLRQIPRMTTAKLHESDEAEVPKQFRFPLSEVSYSRSDQNADSPQVRVPKPVGGQRLDSSQDLQPASFGNHL